MKGTCKGPECEATKLVARGLCAKCYDKWRRGAPELIEAMGGPYVKKLNYPATRRKPKVQAAPDGPAGKPEKSPDKQSLSRAPEGADWDPEDRVELTGCAVELERVQRTIRVLVAAGIVSEEKVKGAYEIAGWK